MSGRPSEPPPSGATSSGRAEAKQPPPTRAEPVPAVNSRRSASMIVGVAAVVVALVAGVLIVASLGGGGGDEDIAGGAAGEVFLQPAQAPGLDPFLLATAELVDIEPVFIDQPVAAPVAVDEPVAAQAISGTELGLYGGTKDNGRCNSEQVITFLEENPAKASAWAAAQGIDPTEIRPFIESLTAGVLLADTRVTNHGFRDGRANPFQAVLQAGTAVLLDANGTPRVRCACGNPLNKPVPQTRTVTYSGAAWDGFDPAALAVVAAAEQPTSQFVLQDLDGGEPFVRERGTAGERDEPAPAAVIAAISPSLIKPNLGDASLPAIGGAAAVAATLDASPSTTAVADPSSTSTTGGLPDEQPTTTLEFEVLQSRDYCDALRGYVAEAEVLFFEDDAGFIDFVDRAALELASIAPPEIAADMQYLSDQFPAQGADGAGDAAFQAAEDRFDQHAAEVCGIE